MRTFLRTAMTVALLAGVLGVAAPPSASAADSENVIVVYKDGVDSDQKTTALEQANLVQPVFRYRSALRGFAAKVTPATKARLLADRDVSFISPDRPVKATDEENPFDSITNAIGSGSVAGAGPITTQDATAQLNLGDLLGSRNKTKADIVPTGVQRIVAAAPGNIPPGSSVGVAVIDTGIATGTGDLNVGKGVNCVRSTSSPNDDNGHGTHVAGTIAAKANQSKVVGVSPGTLLYPVKVLDRNGSGSWSQVICGLDWVTANARLLNIKVVNMSLGGSGGSDNACGATNADALHAAVCRLVGADVTVVVAAGNDGVDFAAQSPASYPEVLTVTAMSDSDGAAGAVGGAPSCRKGERDDAPASFSNYATAAREIAHAVAAPGVCIVSLSNSLFGSTKTLSGTSMAAPHVTGTVALCAARASVPGPCAGLTPAQVIQKIRSDAAARIAAYGFAGDPRNSPQAGRYYGYLVNAGIY